MKRINTLLFFFWFKIPTPWKMVLMAGLFIVGAYIFTPSNRDLIAKLVFYGTILLSCAALFSKYDEWFQDDYKPGQAYYKNVYYGQDTEGNKMLSESTGHVSDWRVIKQVGQKAHPEHKLEILEKIKSTPQ